MEQEYIKGDIVMYDNKIHTIMDTLGVNNYELSYISHPVNQLELSGVPITPEILEKNGWEKDEEASFRTQLYYQNKKDGWVVDMRGEPLKFEIHYIHELQHLFFGLGINHEMEV